MNKLESDLEKEMHKIPWYIEMQMGHQSRPEDQYI